MNPAHGTDTEPVEPLTHLPRTLFNNPLAPGLLVVILMLVWVALLVVVGDLDAPVDQQPLVVRAATYLAFGSLGVLCVVGGLIGGVQDAVLSRRERRVALNENELSAPPPRNDV